MKLARLITVISAALLLGGGFVASQLASLNGEAQAYAVRVDQPAIRYLALAILVGAIGLSLVKDSENESE